MIPILHLRQAVVIVDLFSVLLIYRAFLFESLRLHLSWSRVRFGHCLLYF
jgi:hypothetical protein